MRYVVRPYLLDETAYRSPQMRVLDTSNLSGGLNIWELSYKLAPNQSPDLLNVYWKDGCLSSRPGQAYIFEATEQSTYGNYYGSHKRLWPNSVSGFVIAHLGDSIYKVDPDEGTFTLLYSGLTEQSGTFFVFGDNLYYMNGAEYIQISKSFVAGPVEPYIPIVVKNRTPSGSGGEEYQPENRIASGKEVQFTSDGTSVNYALPYKELEKTAVQVVANGVRYHERQSYTTEEAAGTGYPDIIYYINSVPKTWVNGAYSGVASYSSSAVFPDVGVANQIYLATTTNKYYVWNGTEYVETNAMNSAYQFVVNRSTGTVTFDVAPPQSSPIVASNVSITCFKGDETTKQSILSCRCVTVFGGDTSLAVVCGGPTAQPNAYFWSGNTNIKLDPTYFPFDQYNLAGTADEFITGFGKQQNMLVIFKERSIGKTQFSVETINGRDYLTLPYKPVNDEIGCDVSNSIQLIQNNLVFANTYSGVYVLTDTTSAGENTVARLSRNVNGTGEERGLLYDLRRIGAAGVSSYNDQQRYWLVADEKVYVWDYTLSSYRSNEENLSWFFFDNIQARGWVRLIEESSNADLDIYFKPNGSLVRFVPFYTDFRPDDPEPDVSYGIKRRYTFATQYFGTYEVLKDVIKVIFAVRSDTDSAMDIVYRTDYEQRYDKTRIFAGSWRLVPRNLSYRVLRVAPFATAAVRKPRCFHVRHFEMTIENSAEGTDMSVISAQVVYRYSREDR